MHRFLALAMINLIALFTVFGIIRVLAQTPRAIPSTTQAPVLFSDTFDGDTLDPIKWVTETGTPIVGNGWLTLTAAAIHSRGRFSSGSLQGVIQSLDWKPQNVSTDSSFGLEIWEGADGMCHYGIVFIASGHLGLLRSKPDANKNCTNQSAGIPDRLPSDPYYQAFLPIPNWNAITTTGKVTFTLTWSRGVTLEVSNDITTSQVYTDTSLAIPSVALTIRLNSKFVTETFGIYYIQLHADHVVYLSIVIHQSPPITQNLSVSASAYPFQSTGITVTAGDQLKFSASGNWNCGSGITWPNGNDGIQEPNSPVPNSNLCALVGVIDVDTPSAGSGFFIGSSNQITAMKSGTLYLGSNDNLGKCDGVNPGSCYRDNQGTISVWLSVGQH
jgi:hypothetical protein